MSMLAGRQSGHRLASLTTTRLTELAATQSLPAPERAILGEAALRQRELRRPRASSISRRARSKRPKRDRAPARAPKAMGHETAAGAVQNPVLKRILDAEDRPAALQKKQETLESDQGQAPRRGAQGAGKAAEEAGQAAGYAVIRTGVLGFVDSVVHL